MNVANKLQATKLDTRLSGQGENAGEKRGKQEMVGRGGGWKGKAAFDLLFVALSCLSRALKIFITQTVATIRSCQAANAVRGECGTWLGILSNCNVVCKSCTFALIDFFYELVKSAKNHANARERGSSKWSRV